jgi:hypothetical protein
MVDTLSSNMSDDVIISTDIDIIDLTIEAKFTSIMFNIVQHCSREIFQVRVIEFEIFYLYQSLESSRENNGFCFW